VAATYNPSDKSAAITLSNGNQTATKDGVDAYASVRATLAAPSGAKSFGSVTIDAVGLGVFVGLANSTASLSAFVGSDANGVAYQSTGDVYINGSAVAAYASYTTGSVIDWAYNDALELLWVRKDGGNWNNSGSADPATDTGGLSTAATNAGPYYPAFSGRASTAATANFGATTFPHAAPAGYAGLDATGAVSRTLAAITTASAGVTTINGALAKTLPAITLSAVMVHEVLGSLSSTLGPVALSSSGGFAGALGATLGPIIVGGSRVFMWIPVPVTTETWSQA